MSAKHIPENSPTLDSRFLPVKSHRSHICCGAGHIEPPSPGGGRVNGGSQEDMGLSLGASGLD